MCAYNCKQVCYTHSMNAFVVAFFMLFFMFSLCKFYQTTIFIDMDRDEFFLLLQRQHYRRKKMEMLLAVWMLAMNISNDSEKYIKLIQFIVYNIQYAEYFIESEKISFPMQWKMERKNGVNANDRSEKNLEKKYFVISNHLSSIKHQQWSNHFLRMEISNNCRL